MISAANVGFTKDLISQKKNCIQIKHNELQGLYYEKIVSRHQHDKNRADTVLTNSSKSETAVHCCDPALLVLIRYSLLLWA